MQIIRDLEVLRAAVTRWRAHGEIIALVPTMGALHAGHIALIAEARRRATRVIASIFVNPKQFGPNEDLDRYPRREAEDAAMLEEAGCDLLWAPAVATMYPEGFATTVSVTGISDVLCGAARPGHFDGVATVVTKLFGQVKPDLALFGEKDFQQLAIIRRFTEDLNLGVEIIGVPTQREADGLARSSRNAYLTVDERLAAVALPRALATATEKIAKGVAVDAALAQAKRDLAAAGFDPIDYVALVDAASLRDVIAIEPGRACRLLAAAWLGRTRLIDNIATEGRN